MNLYLVTNTIDNTLYVGKTTQTIANRWLRHLSDARLEKYNSHLHRAIRKYGTDAFTVEPLILLESDFVDENSLNDGERLMIRLLRVNCRLYNLTEGGEGISGFKHTKETRRKISKAKRGKALSGECRRRMSESRKGKMPSQECRRKGLAALVGRPVSEETRRRLSESNRGQNLGGTLPEETRRKISNSLKGRPVSEETRRKISEAKRVRDAAKHIELGGSE